MTADAPPILAIKGFDRDLSCRGHQFAIGETYEHDGPVEACCSGFHACTDPRDVFGYYPPGTSRFCEVELSGETATHDSDSKVAAQRIRIVRELSQSEVVARCVAYAAEHNTPEGEAATGDSGSASATGDRGSASATGYRGSASATGYSGSASATGTFGSASATGDRGSASATGDRGSASATGTFGSASATGYRGSASATGDSGSASATGYSGSASATGTFGSASATGDRGSASATGTFGSASATGDRGSASATGKHAVALAAGWKCSATGADGCALFLVERGDNDAILAVWSGIVGRDGIKAGVAYTLINGKPEEAS